MLPQSVEGRQTSCTSKSVSHRVPATGTRKPGGKGTRVAEPSIARSIGMIGAPSATCVTAASFFGKELLSFVKQERREVVESPFNEGHAHLPRPGQHRALKARARAEGISLAELIRRLAAAHLTGEPRAIPADAYRAIVGLGASGRRDIADEHDRRLADALRSKHAR